MGAVEAIKCWKMCEARSSHKRSCGKYSPRSRQPDGKVTISDKSLFSRVVGVEEVDDGIKVVSFMHYDLGYIDLEEKLCSPSKMFSCPKCILVFRNNLLPMCPVLR
jgi:hypothetical protein